MTRAPKTCKQCGMILPATGRCDCECKPGVTFTSYSWSDRCPACKAILMLSLKSEKHHEEEAVYRCRRCDSLYDYDSVTAHQYAKLLRIPLLAGYVMVCVAWMQFGMSGRVAVALFCALHVPYFAACQRGKCLLPRRLRTGDSR